jgi:hypothetical protein
LTKPFPRSVIGILRFVFVTVLNLAQARGGRKLDCTRKL